MKVIEIQNSTQRIQRLKKRYHEETPRISIERARLYTQKWRETEGQDIPLSARIALCMKNVYENMTLCLDPDDMIAGAWTENFLGIPIDIERGVYNKVLRYELNKSAMMSFRAKSFMKTGAYIVRSGKTTEFLRQMRALRSMGPQPMNLGLETMTRREINRFSITPRDKAELLKELLPYWEGKATVDVVERELMDSDLMGGDMREFSLALPANTSRQTMMISTCATISTYQGHVILDYEQVLRRGLRDMLAEVRLRKSTEENLSKEQIEFLQSMEIAIEGVMIFARRLEERISREIEVETDPGRRAELEIMLESCKAPVEPAGSFRQAVQGAWTLKTAVEIAHPLNLHCLGRMDQIFLPYYQADIERGLITRTQAKELLEELLLKLMSQNMRLESNILSNFYHRYLGSSPVTIGGVKRDGSDAANDLTYLFLEAAEGSRAVTNVSLRVRENTSEDLMLAAADTLYRGSSNISLFNDDVNIPAMMRRGFAEEDARDYAVMGCVEMLCPGRTGGMSANALLLCRALDMTLRNGDSQTLMGKIANVGPRTGDPNEFDSFDQLLDAFMAQAGRQVELLALASNLRDRVFADRQPAPLISAFIQGCLDKKKDVTRGGAEYDLSGLSFINSIANLTDSLYVIKKLVFELEELTIGQIMEAMDHNFVGYEDIHEKILSLEGKWGNGREETDALARLVTDRLFEETYKYVSFRGGKFVPYVISMTTHTIDGRMSIATPDGRRAATPFAASCNPFNVERSGITGVMKSVAGLDFRHVLGAAVNMKFHPSALGREPESRRKWVMLLKTYFRLGGAQLQPTVVSAEILRSAQETPGDYQDLIVKVGGYSAYFTELGREIQDEVISRTEHH